MKFLAALSLVLILGGCNRQPKASPLTGTWLFDDTNYFDHHFQSRIIIDSTGGYTAELTITTSNRPSPRLITIGGYWQLTNGMLIETMTRYSDTNVNFTSPRISRARVIRFNSRELVLKYEDVPGVSNPTHDVTFRKID